MPELVTIPAASFELSAEYERPKFWADRSSIAEGIFRALEPWQPRIDDMEVITAGKISDQGVTIKLLQKRASFFFGAASCKFVQEGVAWQTAEETLSILTAAMSSLIKGGDVAIRTNHAAISLHIQPKAVPFISILMPFFPQQLVHLDSRPLATMAVVGKWPNHKVTLDGSAVVANAAYLRIERDFTDTVKYPEMAGQLRDDEEEIFRLLGIEEDLG